MNHPLTSTRNRALIFSGLAVSLLIAVGLSPFASQNPDGLDRVAQDLKFEHKAAADAPATKLPFHQLFDEYAMRGVPKHVATPLAGLVGTLVTFGLAVGVGKVVIPRSQSSLDISSLNSNDDAQVDE